MNAFPSPAVLARAVLAACAVAGATAAQAQLYVAVDPATGALLVGNGAPGNKNVKVEVRSGGAVTVFDNTGGSPPRSFAGISTIRVATGAGTDELEFDIDSSQSLALAIDTGSGDAKMKLQWKVPAGAAATTSTLHTSSGGGSVNVELDFESETPTSSFAWTTNFGGGEKLIKGAVEFKPGTVNATKNVSFANLGGGFHLIAFEVDNEARNASLVFDAGVARDVGYKVLSDNPTSSLTVDATVRGAKNNVEILSAATTTTARLAGGTANAPGAETNYVVVQTVPGTLAATLDHSAQGANDSKLGAKFDGPANLTLAGRVRGSIVADFIKIESSMPTASSLVVEAGDGNDSVDFIVSNRLTGSAGLPRFLLGGGDDQFNLIAGAGSTAVPAIDCGPGNDIAKANIGNAVGCEQFSR
jgi:hypothetical protein